MFVNVHKVASFHAIACQSLGASLFRYVQLVWTARVHVGMCAGGWVPLAARTALCCSSTRTYACVYVDAKFPLYDS
jgi:hypothetical protein